jgi:hypothetical protein
MVLLMMRGVKASILVGILFCTFISWIPTHDATYFRCVNVDRGFQVCQDRQGSASATIQPGAAYFGGVSNPVQVVSRQRSIKPGKAAVDASG